MSVSFSIPHLASPFAILRRLRENGCRVGASLGIAATLAGCATSPNIEHSARNSKEYFPTSLYGAASPRMVADGQRIPRGGGQYLLGHAYTIAGRTYVPHEPGTGFSQTGTASWYGDAFNGRRTANGEVYDMDSVSAAHPTMPLPSYARVTNLTNQHSIIVRVNDRGPYHASRVMDVSSRVADALDFKRFGTANVRVDYLGPAGLDGSDDRMLMASLRTDGRPATLNGMPDAPATMLASNDTPPTPAPSLFPILFGRPPATTVVARAAPPVADPSAQPEIVQAQQQAQPGMVQAQPGAVVASSSSPSAAIRPGALPARAPLPPVRPFDLGTIPGADVPIMTSPRQHQATATFYAPVAASSLRLTPMPPFRHLDVGHIQSLSPQH